MSPLPLRYFPPSFTLNPFSSSTLCYSAYLATRRGQS